MDIKFVDNKLILPTAKIVFKQNITSVIEIKGGIAVLFDTPTSSPLVENIVALDLNGQMFWKVQPLSEFNPKITHFSPYVGMTVLENGNISATNFFGMNYEISYKDGKILSSKMVK